MIVTAPTWLRLDAAVLALGLALAGVSAHAQPQSSEPAGRAADAPLPGLRAARIATPSGKPVPRFVSLRYDEVNGRRGPGFQYPIAWLYVREGLPVQVIAETETWRKVRDPDGDEVWMHQRTLTRRRTVFALGGARPGDLTPIYAKPEPLAPIVALAERGAVFALDTCEGPWCRIDGEEGAGWAPASHLWGVEREEEGVAMALHDAPQPPR